MNRLLIVAIAFMTLAAPEAGWALAFNFSNSSNGGAEEGTQARAGFEAAGQEWAGYLGDNTTVNIAVGFADLGAGILAQAGSNRVSVSYTDFSSALQADQTTALDAQAVANLQQGSTYDMLLNRTTQNPNGSGSATFYLDNNDSQNNQNVFLTTANARALGFGISSATIDAEITFNTDFGFDFDRTDGISGGFDFIGIAIHEIGHALGFVSTVDELDFFANRDGADNEDFLSASALDLFRYSQESIDATDGSRLHAAIDLTADNRAKYFSLDGGATNSGAFATGINFGDGRQASHWKDDLGLGVMDPTAAMNERIDLTPLDLFAFDAIGWDLQSQQSVEAPTPASFALLLAGAFGLFASRQRARH